MADEYSAKPTVKKASPPTQSKEPSPKYKFEGHKDDIRGFVFLHDNKHIVSGSHDGTMRKWDCERGRRVGKPWEGEGGKIWALALSPNGNIIACERNDGRVEQWNTDGKIIKGIWIRHSSNVWLLSWSPSGAHIASGSSNGEIVIRKAENGKVEVGPIKTGQISVLSLAYSPSGDRIASGGFNQTICIWDSNTGELLVGPINYFGNISVPSIVWSSDSSKLYSASDQFVRVVDSVSGTELHRFEHSHYVRSVALSPKHNVLACVGTRGVAQLWDTESYQPLGKSFSPEDSVHLSHVSFSRDGRYLAYGGDDNKITLWMVEDIAPQLALPAPTTQEETLPEPAPLSYLDVDATNPFAQSGVNDITEEAPDDPYDNFFSSSHSSLPSPSSGPSPIHRLWGVFVIPSLLRTPANSSVQLQERLKRRFLTRRARSPPSPSDAPAKSEPTKSTPDAKVRPGEERNKDVDLPDCSMNMTPGAAEQNKGKQREELPDAESLPPDDASPTAEFDTNENRTFWKFTRARGKNATTSPAQMTALENHPTSTELCYRRRHATSPEVVEVHAARGFQRLVQRKRKHKTKSKPPAPDGSASSMAATSSQAVSAPIPHASGSSQAGAFSQDGPAQAATSSQPAGGSPSHSVETHDTSDDADSDSDSSIQGSWNKFLLRLCFPRGRYHNDRH